MNRYKPPKKSKRKWITDTLWVGQVLKHKGNKLINDRPSSVEILGIDSKGYIIQMGSDGKKYHTVEELVWSMYEQI